MKKKSNLILRNVPCSQKKFSVDCVLLTRKFSVTVHFPKNKTINYDPSVLIFIHVFGVCTAFVIPKYPRIVYRRKYRIRAA